VSNPGSDEALARGCRCAVLDNAHGAGFRTNERGEPLFWITCGCPLHDADCSVGTPGLQFEREGE